MIKFVDKIQNPSVLDFHFEEFTIRFMKDFVDGDRDEMLLGLVSGLRGHLLSRLFIITSLKNFMDG